MAINPETQYPGKIAPSTPDYPYGAARNITLPGDGTGTPWEAALVNDLFGFQQSILAKSGVIPSGTPDKATKSQYLEGLGLLVGAPFDSVAAVASATIPTPIVRIQTAGYSSPGDGGGAIYVRVPFEPTGHGAYIETANGVFFELLQYPVNPVSTGATPDDVDSQAAIEVARDYARDKGTFIDFVVPGLYRWASPIDFSGVAVRYNPDVRINASFNPFSVNGQKYPRMEDVNAANFQAGYNDITFRYHSKGYDYFCVNGDIAGSGLWQKTARGMTFDVDGPSVGSVTKAIANQTFTKYGFNDTQTRGSCGSYIARTEVGEVRGQDGGDGVSELSAFGGGIICKSGYTQTGGNYYNDFVVHGPIADTSFFREQYLAGLSLYMGKWSPGTALSTDYKGAYGLSVFTDQQGAGFGGGGENGKPNYALRAGVAIQGWAGVKGTGVAGGHDAAADVGFETGIMVGGSSGSVWTSVDKPGSKIQTGISIEDYTVFGLRIKPSFFGSAIPSILCEGPARFHKDASANAPALSVQGYGSGAGFGMRFTPETDIADAVIFRNSSAVEVGSIAQTASATAYNTSSDPRLKSFKAPPTDEQINEKFTAVADCLKVFDWKNGGGSDVWGFDAHACIDAGLGIATEGSGPRDLNIGDVYGTIPAVFADVPVYDVIDSGVPELDEDGAPTGNTRKDVIHRVGGDGGLVYEQKEIKPEEHLRVTAAGVDQSKIVPYLVAKIEQLERRIKELEK